MTHDRPAMWSFSEVGLNAQRFNVLEANGKYLTQCRPRGTSPSCPDSVVPLGVCIVEARLPLTGISSWDVMMDIRLPSQRDEANLLPSCYHTH